MMCVAFHISQKSKGSAAAVRCLRSPHFAQVTKIKRLLCKCYGTCKLHTFPAREKCVRGKRIRSRLSYISVKVPLKMLQRKMVLSAVESGTRPLLKKNNGIQNL